MTFDPFGDFETKGYLRNIAREKDRETVRRLEHSAFLTALNGVFSDLSKRNPLTYDDVLKTHESLFDAVYPWAGEDRPKHAPHSTRQSEAIWQDRKSTSFNSDYLSIFAQPVLYPKKWRSVLDGRHRIHPDK